MAENSREFFPAGKKVAELHSACINLTQREALRRRGSSPRADSADYTGSPAQAAARYRFYRSPRPPTTCGPFVAFRTPRGGIAKAAAQQTPLAEAPLVGAPGVVKDRREPTANHLRSSRRKFPQCPTRHPPAPHPRAPPPPAPHQMSLRAPSPNRAMRPPGSFRCCGWSL